MTKTIIAQLFTKIETDGEVAAFIDKANEYSYYQLGNDIVEVAQKINQKEVKKGPIIVYGVNDYRALSVFLGANLSGHAYVPIDAHSPLERVKLIVEACEPAAIIITIPEIDLALKALFENYSTLSLHDFDFKKKHDLTTVDISQAISGTQINYIIYTSGTTGVPKGVAVSHDNLLTFTDWMINDFVPINNNQILSQAPFSFDLSIFSLYPSLLSGGTLVALSREETLNFKVMFERLNRSVINTWISTPSFIDICLLDPSFTQENHSAMQQFIFCGEELTINTAQKLRQKFPAAVIWNTYGPTEATGAVTYTKITDEILKNYDRLPIGQAKSGVEIKIQDPETKAFLPQGGRGEIVITGNSVALGYYKNPEKTAEAFFEVDGISAYHTGDAGLIDESGQLRYFGRLDFQVKFNGFRIELQDIEAHLTAIEGVEKSIVLPDYTSDNKVRRLVAVVQGETNADERAFTKYLKQSLSERIMDYMMPSTFKYVDTFPLTQNGKIDRKAITDIILGK
ncbi:MAG: D-alanine--poly(phosphoribitol) ligase subunit DltA [Streptococcaceae bacterium]|jgi:D-alanine--poly(phosphoribitol) ligase subunit 1|nr:D-alanine--poly(phosphoribitol) ligase subunit DltA [Streptococcaceae bacterium]